MTLGTPSKASSDKKQGEKKKKNKKKIKIVLVSAVFIARMSTACVHWRQQVRLWYSVCVCERERIDSEIGLRVITRGLVNNTTE